MADRASHSNHLVSLQTPDMFDVVHEQLDSLNEVSGPRQNFMVGADLFDMIQDSATFLSPTNSFTEPLPVSSALVTNNTGLNNTPMYFPRGSQEIQAQSSHSYISQTKPSTYTKTISSQPAAIPLSRNFSMEDYVCPPSVESVASSDVGSQGRKAKDMVRYEQTSKGFQLKAGDHIVRKLPEYMRDDFPRYLDMAAQGDDNGTCKGIKLYNEVETALSQEKMKVKDKRNNIPKLLRICHHTDTAAEGREKIRDMWSDENRPENWPREIPFIDPNNGTKNKANGQKAKPKEEDLNRMFDYLKGYFHEHREEIKRKFGLESSVQTMNPYTAKVTAETQRGKEDLEILKEKFSNKIFLDKLGALENQLCNHQGSPSQQFEMASSISALSIRVMHEGLQEADAIKYCEKISGSFSRVVVSQPTQPQSDDMGIIYNAANVPNSNLMDFQTGQLPQVTDPVTFISEIESEIEVPAGPTQEISSVDLLELISQNPDMVREVPGMAQEVSKLSGKGMKRVRSQSEFDIPEKKMKDENMERANGTVLVDTFGVININDTPMPSVGLGEAIPVDMNQAFNDAACNPTVMQALDGVLTRDDQSNLNEFLILNKDSLTTGQSFQYNLNFSDKLASERVPATKFQAGMPNFAIPSTVEAMELDGCSTFTTL